LGTPIAPEGEAVASTENITILFTDLVGSTELAFELAPEVADELRRAHFGALEGCHHQYVRFS
jgi:class 3 adenylate cyclase